jgi:amino acid transporter
VGGLANQAGRLSRPVGVAAPRRRLAARDIALIVVGIVVGAGIFRVPADVAAATGSAWGAMAMWLAGGLAALAGAFTYAELASRYPSMGGEYHFLRLAWGHRVAALFLWARIAVMQTGAIATVAFVAGAHAREIWPAGPPAGAWAAGAVMAVTLWNLASLEAGRRSQQLFVGVQIAAVVAVILATAWLVATGAGPPPAPAGPVDPVPLGLAMVLVMLAYGGWNEAAYVSAEARGGPRGVRRALVGGMVLVIGLYLAVNLAFLAALGREGLAASAAPAPQVLGALMGPAGSAVVSAMVIASVLATMNASVLTGARAMCNSGAHVALFAPLARWDQQASVPRPALLVQGAVTLVLTLYGAMARDGFVAMVAFGAPVFWLFLALTTLSLFRLRRRHGAGDGYSVPLYPFVPLLFLGVCLAMLWSSLDYEFAMLTGSDAGRMAGVLGIALLLVAGPLAARRGRGAAG